ncbi:MAG: hypothetical protein AAGN82_03815 [Myxococcota bacterium]
MRSSPAAASGIATAALAGALLSGCQAFTGDFRVSPGAGGGGGGDTTADGGGGGGGGDSTLSNEALVVRYYLDEAATGLAPTTVVDAGPEPLLPLLVDADAEGSGLTYVTVDGHRGLRFETLDLDARVLSPADDGKIETSLEGQTSATIELVAAIEEVDVSDQSRLVWIGAGNESGRFALNARDTNELEFRWQPGSQVGGRWITDLGLRGVVHLVVDTADPEPAQRARLFRDGVEIARSGGDPPELGEPIGLVGADENRNHLALGNAEGRFRNPVGDIYYAAIYARPLREDEISRHAALLLENDDTPP